MVADNRHADGADFGMSDLEERLRADESGAIHAAILSRLAQLDRDIGAMVGRGLARDEFRQAQAIQGAVAAARTVLARHRRA